KLAAGVRMNRIPFNGDAPAIVQLVGGQIPVKFDNLSTSIPHVSIGRLRALGITTPRRSELLPAVPAIAETLPGYEASIFNGIAAPVATPRDILVRLHAEIVKFTQTADIRSRFGQQGVELRASATPEEFSGFIKTEYPRYAKLVKEAGITAE